MATNTKKLWDDNEAARGAAAEAAGGKPFLAGHGNPWTPREDTWGPAPSGGEGAGEGAGGGERVRGWGRERGWGWAGLGEMAGVGEGAG